MVALLPAEFFFAGGLYAGHAGVVSAAVFVRMPVNVGLVYLGDISKEVSAGVEGVVPHASHLALEARKTVFYLVKAHIGFGRNHAHHGNALEADGAAPSAVLLQFSADEFRRYIQNRRQGHGIEGLDLTGAHKDVVGHLITNQDIPVAVIDDAAGGVDGLIDGGVTVCILLVAVNHLQGKDLSQQYQGGYRKADEQRDMTLSRLHFIWNPKE